MGLGADGTTSSERGSSSESGNDEGLAYFSEPAVSSGSEESATFSSPNTPSPWARGPEASMYNTQLASARVRLPL